MATLTLGNSTDRMPRTGIFGGIAMVLIVLGLFAWALRRAAIPTFVPNAAQGTQTAPVVPGGMSSGISR
jgi:hypothetical protein